MPANVETMFSVRETPWHGLGRIIMDAPASREALELAGLDWQVESRNIYSGTGAMIPGYRASREIPAVQRPLCFSARTAAPACPSAWHCTTGGKRLHR